MIEEINNPTGKGKFIKYVKTPWVESTSEMLIPVNLDGEPYSSKKIHFEVVPLAIDLVIPKDSPCLM